MKIKALNVPKKQIASYINSTINQQVNLEYFSNHVVAKIDALLKRAEQSIQSRIYEALEFAPKSWGLSLAENAVKNIIYRPDDNMQQADLTFTDALKTASEYSAEWQIQQFVEQAPFFNFVNPPATQIYQAAISQPFEGRYLNEWWNDNNEAAKKKIMQNFRIGYLTGQSNGQITKSVMDSLKETGSISSTDNISKLRKNAETIVRTGISDIANKSRIAVADANSDIIKQVTFVATLDTRTCLVCARYDGRSWDVSDPDKPTIPVHFNCRCTWAYKMVAPETLGIPKLNWKRQRASMDGQVSQSVSYKDWLAEQPASRQDEILGTVKGGLYRSGKYDPFNFTNLKTNQYNDETLKQTLKRK